MKQFQWSGRFNVQWQHVYWLAEHWPDAEVGRLNSGPQLAHSTTAGHNTGFNTTHLHGTYRMYSDTFWPWNFSHFTTTHYGPARHVEWQTDYGEQYRPARHYGEWHADYREQYGPARHYGEWQADYGEQYGPARHYGEWQADYGERHGPARHCSEWQADYREQYRPARHYGEWQTDYGEQSSRLRRACQLSVTVRFGGCGPCMEQSAGRCHFVDITADIPDTAEDRTVCSELLIAPAPSDALPFTVRAARASLRFCFCLFFSFVRCPSSLWHYATLITFVQ